MTKLLRCSNYHRKQNLLALSAYSCSVCTAQLEISRDAVHYVDQTLLKAT